MPETPLEPTQTDEQAYPDLPVHVRYLLIRGERRVELLQFSGDTETTQTIDHFLNFCRDMGWTIEKLE